MSKEAFGKIAEGLADALDFARGNAKAATLHVPPEIDVRAVRNKTGLAQDTFASTFGFSVHQVRQWEQGRTRPTGALRAYLMLIARNHEQLIEMLKSQITYEEKAA